MKTILPLLFVLIFSPLRGDIFRILPTEPPVSEMLLKGDYRSAAPNTHRPGEIFTSYWDGRIDRLLPNGKSIEVLSGTPLVSMTARGGKFKGQVFGVGEDGGVYLLFWSGADKSWQLRLLVEGEYVAIARLPMGEWVDDGASFAVARKDGGIDRIHWVSSGWTASRFVESEHRFKALAPNLQDSGLIALRADGKLETVSSAGDHEIITSAGAIPAQAIATSIDAGATTIYAAKEGGGIVRLSKTSESEWMVRPWLNNGAEYDALFGVGDGEGFEGLYAIARYDKGNLPASLPSLPDFIFGVNQYAVGPPEKEGKNWPLTDADVEYLKSLGCNTIRFPLYPGEVGIDEKEFLAWGEGGSFSPESLGEPDWRSLDAVIEFMIKHQLTPAICPSPELRGDWSSKTWMSLHVPEHADRALWFTKLVVDHVTEKFGDQVIYGWYENWWWNSYKHEQSLRFPEAFKFKIEEMYKGDISSLNENWESSYVSFDEIEVPTVMEDGVVAPAAINSRRTYDLRKAIDLMHRDHLSALNAYIKDTAPGAWWGGGCLLNSIGGLADIRSVPKPRTNATMRTAAETGDFLSADLYSDGLEYYSHYRTLSKFAHVADGKLFIAEVPGVKPRAFELVADVGGPSIGAAAWVGKEDTWGLIKWDGTKRIENGLKWKKLHDTYDAQRARFAFYRPGEIHVYFPEETLNYSISDLNFIDAYQHICDFMMPGELELVLTDELVSVPGDAPIYVLERTLPLQAIEILESMGDRVVCPHDFFIDENGKVHPRNGIAYDQLYDRLRKDPGGSKLMDVFLRVEERARNLAFSTEGASIATQTALADKNVVLPGRRNLLTNLIDGSIYDGVTFADSNQTEEVIIDLGGTRIIDGAFVDFSRGNGTLVAGSRLPPRVVISASADGVIFEQIAEISGDQINYRSRIRFQATPATHVRFDFGTNEGEAGLRLVELGVLGE